MLKVLKVVSLFSCLSGLMHQSIKIILNILKYSPEYVKENIKIFSRPWWVALKRGLGRGMLLRPSKLDLVLDKIFHFATLFKTRDQSY